MTDHFALPADQHHRWRAGHPIQLGNCPVSVEQYKRGDVFPLDPIGHPVAILLHVYSQDCETFLVELLMDLFHG